MEPFDLLEYEEPSRLDRAFKVSPKRNAYVELHNLIAAAPGPHAFGPEDVRRIGRERGVRFQQEFFEERRRLYATYLVHCLDQGDLSDTDRATLAHLARTLYLEPDDLRPVHERAFGRTVSSALADDCLSIEERLLLYKLQHTLGLDLDEADQVYEKTARQKLLAVIARTLCDGELSPEEAEEIRALERRLDVAVPEKVEAMLDDAVYRWRLRTGPLPEAKVFVSLLPGEVGHFSTQGSWREVNYARLRVLMSAHRGKIHRGETAGLSVPEKAFYGRKWHEGHIEVTSKRLILARGRDEPVRYGLISLVDVELYRNGIRVSVRHDRSFFLRAGSDTRTLYRVLWRALHPGQDLPTE